MTTLPMAPLTPFPQRRQSGTVLLVSLIVLLVMTLLGVASMRGATLEERMAGNWRDQNIALQAAEAALRAGEESIPEGFEPDLYIFPCTVAAECGVFEPDGAIRNSALDADANWEDSARRYEGDISGAAAAPRFVVERRAYVRDHLGTGHGEHLETGVHLFQVTARGAGQTEATARVLQTGIARRYD